MRTGPMNLPPASRMVPYCLGMHRFANPAITPYLQPMPKHIELPPRIARAFVRDMRAFFKAKNQLKQDEIASRQLHALAAFQRRRDKKLRLADLKQMVLQMRGHARLSEPLPSFGPRAMRYRKSAFQRTTK